jgi:hypothetical protein
MKVTLMTLVLAAAAFAQFPPPFCPPHCPSPPDASAKQKKPKVAKKPIPVATSVQAKG